LEIVIELSRKSGSNPFVHGVVLNLENHGQVGNIRYYSSRAHFSTFSIDDYYEDSVIDYDNEDFTSEEFEVFDIHHYFSQLYGITQGIEKLFIVPEHNFKEIESKELHEETLEDYKWYLKCLLNNQVDLLYLKRFLVNYEQCIEVYLDIYGKNDFILDHKCSAVIYQHSSKLKYNDNISIITNIRVRKINYYMYGYLSGKYENQIIVEDDIYDKYKWRALLDIKKLACLIGKCEFNSVEYKFIRSYYTLFSELIILRQVNDLFGFNLDHQIRELGRFTRNSDNFFIRNYKDQLDLEDEDIEDEGLINECIRNKLDQGCKLVLKISLKGFLKSIGQEYFKLNKYKSIVKKQSKSKDEIIMKFLKYYDNLLKKWFIGIILLNS